MPNLEMMSPVILEKLPPVQREGRSTQRRPSSYSSQSHFGIPQNWEQTMGTTEDWQEDYFPRKMWQNQDLVKRKPSSATTRRKMYPEEKTSDFLLQKYELNSIFPSKPVLHKRTVHPNNYQADYDYFAEREQRRTEYNFPSSRDGKQMINRRQGVAKLTTEYQALNEDQRTLYEHQIQLTKKIQEKKKTLQEKLLSAEEELRKVQLRTTSGHKEKGEERMKNIVKVDNRLYNPQNGTWDWENTIGISRNEVHRERNRRDWGTHNKDIGIREKREIEMKVGQRGRPRKEIEWGSWERNQRTTDCKDQKDERDYYEEMRKQKWKTARTVQEKNRRESAIEWGGNENRGQDRRDWQERADDGERRSGRARVRKDIEKEDEEKWDIMDSFKSNSHVKASKKHDKTNGLAVHDWATQERSHQSNVRAADEMTSNIKNIRPRESLTQAAPHAIHTSQKGKILQQAELCPESPDIPIQLITCKVCHRHFREDRLETHSKICKKISFQRKTFDSSKQRAKGTSLEEFMKTNTRSKTPEIKKNWRQKHEALICNLRQARVPASGGIQSKMSMDPNPDYISCPHCGRRFAPGPAERHIPKCQNIKSRPPPPKHR